MKRSHGLLVEWRRCVAMAAAIVAASLVWTASGTAVVLGQGNPGGGNQGGGNPGGGNPGGGNAGGNVVRGVPLGSLGAGGPARRVPDDDYYISLASYYSGDYAVARRNFLDVSRGGIKGVDGRRWIDSICYHTMLGECHYQMGDLVASLDQHTTALSLYLANLTWMVRVDFPPAPDLMARVSRPPTWGASRRTVALGRYPDTLRTFMGQTDAGNMAAVQQGGVIAQPQLYPIGAMEILRCITLSLKRRAELVGPTGQYDPITERVLAAVMQRPGPANHWSQCFLDLQIGLALLAAGKPAQAASELQKSLLAGGQFEHPLTCVALLELGKISLAAGQWDAAATAFAEATYSAAVYGQYDVLEEAFRGAVSTHLQRGNKTFFAPLEPAAVWADRTSVSLQATLYTLAAENLLAIGESARAMAMLIKARTVLGRHDALLGLAGARYQFELAKGSFQTGNLAVGNTALAAAMVFQTKGSKRVFQSVLANNLYVANVLSDRSADALYTEVLREPQPADWSSEPMETLAVSMVNRFGAMENWFEVALKRNEPERACEIADRVRRQRFFASLPLGGRMLALRWVLDGPVESLGDRGLLQRRDIFAKYPQFAETARLIETVRQEIAKEPLTFDTPEAMKPVQQKYEQLAKLAAAQELILHDMSVQRLPADYAFPPLLSLKDLQPRLPEKTLVLAYYNASRGLYGFAITRDKYAIFRVESPNKLRADLVEMAKRMGLRDRTQPLAAKDLSDLEWRVLGERLGAVLTNNAKPESWDQYSDVVIVPDGPLWYCPFEALPVARDGEFMIAKTRVRYVPSVSMAAPDARPTRVNPRTAVVAGRLYPTEDLKVAAAAAEELAGVLPQVTRLPNRLPAPSSLVAKFVDRLVVYHDMEDSDRAPYDWSPVQIDQKKPASNLASLLSMPWGGPSQVIYPGFHSAIESGLKKGGAGDELFLTVCGLMATGTQTALLSRWRVGGESSYDLIREFAQELPHTSASAAWQRSVLLKMDEEIDPAREPRVRPGPPGESISARHPFFWSGYLLADTAAPPAPPADDAADKAAQK